MPTRNRPTILAETLRALAMLPRHEAELIIVDNASDVAVDAPPRLGNGLPIEVVRLPENRGTAARNAGCERAVARTGGSARDDHWIVMLDDDSSPVSLEFHPLLGTVPTSTAVVAAEVVLDDSDGKGRHEAGGLPEVFVGCGAAIRASVFVGLGGYDPAFDYYAEEYDFCARVLLAGMRVQYDRRYVVKHRKVSAGRDMHRIIGNLVRNNGIVMARYAPDAVRGRMIEEQVARYGRIAATESALAGYERGVRELRERLPHQPRTPLPAQGWKRFTGYAAVAEHLQHCRARPGWGAVAIVEQGKHADVLEQALRDAAIPVANDAAAADTLVVGTLSPGPMLDAQSQTRELSDKPVVTGWRLTGECR
jgi:glycosyltransferase involved in cell wall biosynthesis